MRQWQNVLAASVMALAASVAWAQAYPARPVKAIVPFPAGGPLDFVVRLVSEKMSVSLGQPFVIENRAGAFGSLGAELVAKSPPDGYTLLWVVDPTMTVNPSLYPKLAYDPVKDFAPVALVTTSTSVLVVHPSVAAVSVAELIALAKSRPLAYASGGNGSPGHLLGEQFKSATGVPMTHVPFKGNAPAVQSMLSGQTQVFFSSLPGVLQQIRGGKLRSLAVTSATRSSFAPDLPTMRESGVPEMDLSSWYALFAPAKTPQAVIDLLYREAAAAVHSPDLQEKLKHQGLDPVVAPPDGLAARMREDARKWAKVVREAKMTVD